MKKLIIIALLFSGIVSTAQVGVGTTSPNSTLDVRGALSLNYRVFTGTSTSISGTDNTIVFTGTAASTATLPDATACVGRMYRIKNASSNSSVLTIATTSSQTIDGLSSWVLDEQNETIAVVSNGSNWDVSSQSLPNSSGTWIQGGNNVVAAKNLGTISNYDLPFITNNTERMRITATGNAGVGTSTFSGTNPEKLIVDAGTDGSGKYQNVIVGKGNTNSYAQLNIQNNSSGAASSSDVVATANNGNENLNYIDMGINGGSNTSSGILGGTNTAYLYSTGNDFALGNSTSNKNLLLFTGGTATGNERMRIDGSGNVGIGNNSPTALLHLKAGTSSASSAPLKFTTGTNMTTAEAGAVEFDGVNTYITNETTSGRGAIPVEQHFLLTSTGSAISSIANYFGATSNISLVSGGYYEIDIYCYFLKTTASTVTWTFTNSAAPTSMDIHYDFSAASGIVSTAAATSLFGDQYNLTSAAPTVVTSSLSNGAYQYAHFKIILLNGTGTSLKIQATAASGSLTPGIGSRWYCKRISTSNVGTFAN